MANRRAMARSALFFILLPVTLVAIVVSLVLAAQGSISPLWGAVFMVGFFGALAWLITMRLRGKVTPDAHADQWIHWHYPPEQWKQWTELQYERMKASPVYSLEKLKWPGLPAAFGLIVVAAAGVVVLNGPWRERALFALFVFVVTFVSLAAALVLGRTLPVTRRTHRLQVTPEALVGPDGVLSDGVYTPWAASTIWLSAAFVNESPPRNLVFRFTTKLEQIDRCVLIPAGPAVASDIARVQHELSLACPNARIRLCDPCPVV
jgi:hypothetical protein